MAVAAALVLAVHGTSMVAAAAPSPLPSPLDPAIVGAPAAGAVVRPGAPRALVLRAQILLDRTHFRAGEIDGGFGTRTRRAVTAFQESRGLPPTGVVDAPTWDVLESDADPVLVPYTVTPEDVAGPFVPIPADMMAKAALPYLGYASALEEIAERFHVSPEALLALNPGKTITSAGEELQVPNVPARPLPPADAVVVSAERHAVEVRDERGATIASYPATTGSTHDPLPLGRWRIEGRAWNPVFHYNPRLFWDADPRHEEATLAPGPNNPVGLVWIELSKPHYGIHGTPEPAMIGRTHSHGCIRLTNWDAVELAEAVRPGMPALLEP